MEKSKQSNKIILFFALFAAFTLICGCAGIPDLTEKGNTKAVPNPIIQLPAEPAKLPAPPTSGVSANLSGPVPSIIFVNVGMGESTLLLSKTATVLIDAGPDQDATAIRNALSEYGVRKIDMAIITRPDKARFEGLGMLTRGYDIREVAVNGAAGDSDYANLLSDLNSGAVTIETAKDGWGKEIGDFHITALNPAADENITGQSDSRDSLVLLVKKGKTCTLLMSDTEASGAASEDAGTVFGGIEARIAARPEIAGCQILGVGNYASGNSASFQLLNAMKPQFAVVSVGKNTAGLPSQTALSRLALQNITVFRTDTQGDISVYSDGAGATIAPAFGKGPMKIK